MADATFITIFINALAIIAGVTIGLVRGGHPDNVRAVQIRLWPVLGLGFALQALAEISEISGALYLSVIGMFLLVVGLLGNALIRGAAIAAGVGLNLIVTVANGHVPVRFEALQEADMIDAGVAEDAIRSIGGLRELETADTTLAGLGDVIPVFSTVLSLGDLVTMAGIALIVQSFLVGRRRVGLTADELFGASLSMSIVRYDPPEGPILVEPAERGEDELAGSIRFGHTVDLREHVDLTETEARREAEPMVHPFESVSADASAFDYGQADDFSDEISGEGISSLRRASRRP